MSATYPLLFTHRERLIVADHFVGVETRGRALASRDDDSGEWWFYGVNPGAIAACGSTVDSAHAEFCLALRNVFLDFAAGCHDVTAFRHEVEEFFRQVADQTDAEWWDAVKAVRAGQLSLAIERKPAESERGVDVKVIVAPNLAEFEYHPLQAAA